MFFILAIFSDPKWAEKIHVPPGACDVRFFYVWKCGLERQCESEASEWTLTKERAAEATTWETTVISNLDF